MVFYFFIDSLHHEKSVFINTMVTFPYRIPWDYHDLWTFCPEVGTGRGPALCNLSGAGLLYFLIGQTGERIYLIMQNKGGMVVITPEMIDSFMSINMETVNMESLADISTLELDNSLPKEKRLDYVLEKLNNPFCFRYGEMGIKLEFDDNAPPMSEVLTNFLIRKKSGS